MLVVRRTQDAEGRFPEAEVYVVDGHSESNAFGFVWEGSILESHGGRRSCFPVSEIMDLIRVSPDGIVDGPFTPPCLRPTPAKE